MLGLIKDWKKKRAEKKKLEHEKLLRELEEMVDKRRCELLREKELEEVQKYS